MTSSPEAWGVDHSCPLSRASVCFTGGIVPTNQRRLTRWNNPSILSFVIRPPGDIVSIHWDPLNITYVRGATASSDRQELRMFIRLHAKERETNG